MTSEEERRYALRGHYVLESQREAQADLEPEPDQEQQAEPEQPVKASFPKAKQGG